MIINAIINLIICQFNFILYIYKYINNHTQTNQCKKIHLNLSEELLDLLSNPWLDASNNKNDNNNKYKYNNNNNNNNNNNKKIINIIKK